MQTYFMNLSAQAQATFLSTSAISAVSSLLIISIILRSPSRLSSVYHKIMFSLSCWDTLSSVAMALTTLPMSKDVLGLYVYDTVPDDALVPYFIAASLAYLDPNFEVYNFSGLVLGNAGTCAAQGFVINIGQTFAIYSNVTLSIYYVCTIRFKMTEETARKKLLPIMVGISLLLGIPSCLYPLIMGLFTPQPFEPYCTWGPYPYGCNFKGVLDLGFELPDCIRGNAAPQFDAIYGLIIASFLGLCFIVMAVSLVLVVMSVFQTEMAVRRKEKEDRAKQEDQANGGDIENISDPGDVENNFEETRTVLRLALMYIAAFFITWIWTVLANFISIEDPDISFVNTIHLCNRIFLPSQGFFNALIFIYNKICFARQVIPNLTFSDALKMVIFSPSAVPEALVSSLDIVMEDMNEREQEAERVQELIEANLEGDQNQEDEGEENDEVSTVFPVSLPSNFESVETPSFALSNAMSSQGIDKEQEDRIKKDGDPNDTRQFYADTPTEYLNFTGDTLAAAWTLDQNSGHTSPLRLSEASSPMGKVTMSTSKGRDGGSEMSGASSVYTSKSLLSGFSNVLSDPSSQSHIISEEGEEDVNEAEGHEREVLLESDVGM